MTSKDQIKQAAKLLKEGQLVIFPTETVYGIGADATNQEACLKIFRAKSRPSNNPLIVHVASIEAAKELAIFNEDANKLATLWPGPISLVLPSAKNSKIAPSVQAGLSSIAIRVPMHKIAQTLLSESSVPIAAPSANISGKLTSTTQKQVAEYFADSEICILSDDMPCEVGLESTIIDLSTEQPTILRHGFFTQEFLSSYLNKEVAIAHAGSKVKAPGMLLRHYSPKCAIRLNASNIEQGELGLNYGDSQLESAFSLNLSVSGNLQEAASNLFHFLYLLDNYASQHNYKVIAVAPVPNFEVGVAINDRLSRAASSSSS